MFAQIPERRMHVVHWILTIAWLIVIASLFYDPWTPGLTEPNHPWSPLRLSGSCISVQGKCLVEQPYPLATTLFWGAIVAEGDFTRILAVPVSAFDDLLGRDRDFARRVLELESRQLQKFMRSLPTISA
jgi:hypothetical protein